MIFYNGIKSKSIQENTLHTYVVMLVYHSGLEQEASRHATLLCK